MEKRRFCICFGSWWSIVDWRYSEVNPEGKNINEELGEELGYIGDNDIFNMYQLNKNRELIGVGDWSELTQKMIDAVKNDMRLYEEVSFEVYDGKKVVEKFDGKLIDGLLWVYNNKKRYTA